MASAQFVSNEGSWMQTIGVQELMLTLTTSATLVALIQTAAGLPIVLLAIPAGALGDVVDRRRLLIASQSFMLLAAGVLAGLAFAGVVTPVVLLVLIFAVGAGLFMLFANSIWALLPIVAHTHLHLGSGGYGLLLGGVGIGAVAGAAGLPRLRERVPRVASVRCTCCPPRATCVAWGRSGTGCPTPL